MEQQAMEQQAMEEEAMEEEAIEEEAIEEEAMEEEVMEQQVMEWKAMDQIRGMCAGQQKADWKAFFDRFVKKLYKYETIFVLIVYLSVNIFKLKISIPDMAEVKRVI
jgi:aminoglycoside/choline kinase family phosphotransferase